MTISRRKFFGALGASLAVENADLFADKPKHKPLRANRLQHFWTNRLTVESVQP